MKTFIDTVKAGMDLLRSVSKDAIIVGASLIIVYLIINPAKHNAPMIDSLIKIDSVMSLQSRDMRRVLTEQGQIRSDLSSLTDKVDRMNNDLTDFVSVTADKSDRLVIRELSAVMKQSERNSAELRTLLIAKMADEGHIQYIKK